MKSNSATVFTILFLSLLFSTAITTGTASAQQWTVFDTDNSGLPNNTINSITTDADGLKWIGTNGGGVAVYDGENWTVYNSTNSDLPSNNVWVITIGDDGVKWIGTSSGLARLDGTEWTVWDYWETPLPIQSVRTITIDAEGNKWIGGSSAWDAGGLSKFDDTDWTVYTPSNSDLPSGDIRSLAIDAESNIWIGTNWDGMAVFDGNENWTVYTADDSDLPNDRVISLTIDGDNTKWIGTHGGLVRHVEEDWTVFTESNSELPNNQVWTVAIEGDSVQWIGTLSGMTRLEEADWTVYYTHTSGLPANHVRVLNVDGEGPKWIGTDAGGLAIYVEAGEGLVHALNSSVTAEPDQLPVGGISTVIITLQDEENNLIPGREEENFTIMLTGDATVVAGSFEESEPGVYEVGVTNETIATVTVTVEVDGVELADKPEITFITDQFAGGDGSPENPYQIENIDQLQAMMNHPDKHFIVIADIDASVTADWNEGLGFEPVGNFSGSINGDGFIITGLTINRPLQDNVGLFQIFEDGVVKNLKLEDVNITGNNHVGGLASWNFGIIEDSFVTGIVTGSDGVGGLVGVNVGIIENSYASGDISGEESIGGLAGVNREGTIVNSHATGSVSGKTNIGGLAGGNHNVIQDSYATGSVTGLESTGGLVGVNYFDAHITKCYTTGIISGETNTGGLVGYNLNVIEDSYATGNVTGSEHTGGLVGVHHGGNIENSYSAGSVEGIVDVGGLVGSNWEGTIITNYWNIERSGQEQGVGDGEWNDTGIYGLSDAAMRQQSFFMGFDFSNTWNIVEEVSFPFLRDNPQNPPPGVTEFELDRPVLVGPENESQFIKAPVFLRWKPVNGADDYIIEISHNENFDGLLNKSAPEIAKSALADTDLIQNEWGVYFELESVATDTVYYWRVKAENEQGQSDWSEVWSFNTGLAIPEVPVWEPEHEAESIETTPLLVWNATERAEVYDLQLAGNPDFSDILIEVTDIPDTQYQITEDLQKGVTYHWRIRAGNRSGYSDWSNPLSFTTLMPTDAFAEEIPEEFALKQNYPNPFNPVTTIRYELAEDSKVLLEVFDVLGRRMAILVNEGIPAGTHQVIWDASNQASGLYIYRLQAGDYIYARPMLLVK